MISDVNKHRAFLRQDLDCLVRWIVLESWCIHTASGKVTHTHKPRMQVIFSVSNRELASRNSGHSVGAILDEEVNVNSQCEAGATGADAILVQVDKGI